MTDDDFVDCDIDPTHTLVLVGLLVLILICGYPITER